MSDWEDWLPLAEFSINNAWKETIQYTPFEMNGGQHPKTPLTLRASARQQTGQPGDWDPAAERFRAKIDRLLKKARKSYQEAQARQKMNADNRWKLVEPFFVGSSVLLSTRRITLSTPGPSKLWP